MLPSNIELPLTSALSLLHSNDSRILIDGTNERSITHRLGLYLQIAFLDWTVDCEYNRVGNDGVPKRLGNLASQENIRWDDPGGKTIYPDIVVHRRGSSQKCDNLLSLEIKLDKDASTEDIHKLHAYATTYQYSIFLKVAHRRNTWYQVASNDLLTGPEELRDFNNINLESI